MVSSTPVTVITSFTLSPQSRDTWLLAWQEVARVATRQPKCREFRLLQNRQSDERVAVLTTWESAEALSQFVRRSGMVWLDDALNESREHSEYVCFDDIGVGAGDHADVRELVGAGAR